MEQHCVTEKSEMNKPKLSVVEQKASFISSKNLNLDLLTLFSFLHVASVS